MHSEPFNCDKCDVQARMTCDSDHGVLGGLVDINHGPNTRGIRRALLLNLC